MKKRIGSALLAVLLTLSLSVSALATGTSAYPDLSVSATQQMNWVFFHADLADVEATNGRLCISYDASQLSVKAVWTEGDWITSINTDTAGQIWFAWVGRELNAGEHKLNVTFQLLDADAAELTISSEMTELYNNGVKLDADKAYTEDKITVPVGSTGNVGGDVEIPLPTPPQPPVAPDDEPQVPGTVTNPFVDIDNHWAKENILKAWEAGLVNGTTATTFSPNGEVTRGMFVTLLYRLSGAPAVTGTTPFADVPAGKYYEDAVLWAYRNSVVNGTGDTTFSPEKLVTRQEMVTMLYRYAKLTGEDVSANTALNSYTDAANVASWAQDAMQWAVAEGTITGYAGKLDPMSNTKRAEAATILVRFAGL